MRSAAAVSVWYGQYQHPWADAKSAERRCVNVDKEKVNKIIKENIRDMLSILKTVLFVTVVMFFLNGFVIANAVIPTSSMAPTIEPGDRVIGLRFLRDYERGDIIVFDDPDSKGRYLIKRIVGVAGDRVSFTPEEGGTCSVSINGKTLKEPYLAEAMLLEPEFESLVLTIPDDFYFCLGDNRNNSQDARYWEHKLIAKDKVAAKAVFKYWPFSRAGVFKRPDYKFDGEGMSSNSDFSPDT